MDCLDVAEQYAAGGVGAEPLLAEAEPGARFQFEREGYFCADPDHSRDRPIFNRAVTLRDSWAKLEKQKG